MRPLSYSSISTYIECPLKFKLKYVDGLKEKPKPYLSFGSSLHEALQFLYSYRPPPPSLEAVLKYYEENWISEGYANEEEEEGYFSYGKKILKDYYNTCIKEYKPPVAVEHKFDIEIDGLPVTGFIDRIDKLKDDKTEIIDYKSGKNIFDRSHVEENEQLTMYQLAVEESIGLSVGKLTLYHLPSQTPVSVDARNKEKIEALKTKIQRVAESIKEGNFEAKKGRFCPCDFPEHCPYYRHLYIKEEEEKGKSKVNIQQTIEEYSELKEREKELSIKIKELAERIHTYCEEKGLMRVFGDEHAITRIKSERKGYDEERLKELLEPEGLWERLLAYDDSLTKELLESHEIDEHLKNEIRKLEEVKKTIHQIRVRELKENERKDDL
ncbi:MAG: PD-(D/E)XK nuclease family protein [Thermoplasmata archaeon]|nr:MAG: PD-(D/E)XK nuclease family protein [Thermoplasmata archaeon]